MRKAELISGKVKKVPSSQANPDRYNFLDLRNAEPDLGVPTLNDGISASDTDGSRKWLYLDSGLTVDGSGNITLSVETDASLVGEGTTSSPLGHADTSNVSDLVASSRTYVDSLTFDEYGHVTGYTTETETVVDNYVDGGSFDASTSTITLTRTNAFSDIDIDLSSLVETDTLDSVTSRGNSTTNEISVGNITTSGYVRGPTTFTIDPATHGDNTGKVVIAGDLQVDGTTTTINSSTLDVDDLNVTLAKNAVDASAANGAGITIDGANATFTYVFVDDVFDFNKGVVAPNFSGDGTNVTNVDAVTLNNESGSYYLDFTNFTNVPDPTITLSGDASGSVTLTDLSDGTLEVTILDDSHSHVISNVDGLQGELDSKVDENPPITAGTATKITYDEKGLVTAGGDLVAADIPDLDAAKITSGTFADDRISSTSVTQHEGDLTITENQISDLQDYLLASDIDTLAELSAIITDATLVDVSHTHTASDITDFTTEVTSVVDGLTIDADTLNGKSDTDFVLQTEVGQADGVASLDSSGLLPESQLPPVAVSTVNTVADNNERDALIVQTGDIAKVTSTGLTFVYDGSQWIEISSDVPVYSVNGEVGDVVLTTDDINEDVNATNLYFTEQRTKDVIDQAYVNSLNIDADTLDGIDSTGFDESGTGMFMAFVLG